MASQFWPEVRNSSWWNIQAITS